MSSAHVKVDSAEFAATGEAHRAAGELAFEGGAYTDVHLSDHKGDKFEDSDFVKMMDVVGVEVGGTPACFGATSSVTY